MTKDPCLDGWSVLIVDGESLSAAELSERLAGLGAKVHVVANVAAAASVVRSKRLNVALLASSSEECTQDLVRSLDLYGVPYIRCARRIKEAPDYRQFFNLPFASN